MEVRSPTFMAGIQNASRLDHHQFCLSLRRCPVLLQSMREVPSSTSGLARLEVNWGTEWGRRLTTQGPFQHVVDSGIT